VSCTRGCQTVSVGKQGWHSGEDTILLPWRHKWAESVVWFLPYSKSFSLGFPVFLLHKNQLFKILIWFWNSRRSVSLLTGCATANLIYLFNYFKCGIHFRYKENRFKVQSEVQLDLPFNWKVWSTSTCTTHTLTDMVWSRLCSRKILRSPKLGYKP